MIKLTSFHLKVIAAAFMVIDHLGIALDINELRILGRMSFPLFVWLICKGYSKTKSFKNYQWRILLLAIISQVFVTAFRLHFDVPITFMNFLNPVFNLWLGLHAIDAFKNKKYVLLTIIMLASLFTSYGFYGVIMGLLFSLCVDGQFFDEMSVEELNKVSERTKAMGAWIFVYCFLHLIQSLTYPIQLWTILFILAIPTLAKINVHGSRARWFYFFYPFHFLPLLVIPP